MKRFRKIAAWVMFLSGGGGFWLSAFELVAKDEPKFVLLLSWAALWYEGFNAVMITEKES